MFKKSSFPLVYQHDTMLCGIACLQMICKYYGKDYSSNYLTKVCAPTNEGVSLYGISESANSIGFHSLCGRATVEQLRSAPKPCILHWNQDHFVVLYKIKNNKFYIADPGKGHIIYSEAEFRKYWISSSQERQEKGIALFIQTTPAFYSKKDLSHKGNRSFGFLLGYFKQYKQYFGQVFLGLLVGSLLQLTFPFLTQAIVDIGIANKSLNFIYLILLAQLALTIGRTSIDLIRNRILLYISVRINISLVSDFFIKLLQLPMAFFETKLLGDLIERMNDHARIEKFLTVQTLSVIFSFLTFIIFGSVLFFYSPTIFIVFLLGGFIYGTWITLFLKRRRVLDHLYFEKQSENNTKTYRFITSMQEIKLQNCEQRRRWEWEDVQADIFNVQIKRLNIQQTEEAGSIFINETKNIIITILAATSVINGEMTLGMMLAVQYIIGQLNSPVEQLVNFLYSFQEVSISLERINEIHQMDEEDNKELLRDFSETPQDIQLKSVNFKYDRHSFIKTLEDISITIPAGKTTAIVGASGSGKTTLIKLLLGYYHVLSGDILIGNIPLEKLNKKWWRQQCGTVMQNGVIFSESIARNIAVGDEDINMEKLNKAAQIANIKDYIQELPLKYNTKIGDDGMGLSQGQKQRILIARAVYKDPQFMFFDEATNSLDVNNEKIIVNNLREFYKGRTVVIVAHRLSTVKDADNILVLDKGKILETGTHDSLISKKGVYYRLIKNQLELGN